jgi:hypothetical protein
LCTQVIATEQNFELTLAASSGTAAIPSIAAEVVDSQICILGQVSVVENHA